MKLINTKTREYCVLSMKQCQFYLYFAHLSIFQNIPSHAETHCPFKWCVFFPWTKPGPTIHLASMIPSTSASQWKMSKTAAKL